MYCDIKETKYGKQLAKQIGDRQAKEFAMAVDTPTFQEWFGSGKTVTLENGYITPFINPIMQVINGEGKAFNLLERFRFKSQADVEKFLQADLPGISLVDNATYAVARDENRFINSKLLTEIERIYPDLLVTNEAATMFTINPNFEYVKEDKPLYSKEDDLVKQAIAEAANIKGLYRQLVDGNPREAMFEAAYQAISSPAERKGAETVFGKKFVELSLLLYPHIQKGDTYESYTTKYQKTNEDTTKPAFKVKLLLDKLSARFNVPYRTIYDANSDTKGYYDTDGTVVINLAKVTGDTPFHEFAHPFILVLEQQNPALYQALANELQTTKDGIQTLATVTRLYPELNNAQRTHEAIVQYIGKLAEQRYSKPASPFVRFFNWLKSIFKKINIRMDELSIDTKLSDIAELMTDDIYVVDLRKAQMHADAIIRESRTDTELTYEDVFERIKDKILILSATIKRRKEGEAFRQDIEDLKEMLEKSDEITSINNFVTNSVAYVDAAQKRFEKLRESVKDPSKLNKEDLSYNMYILGEIQQLLNVYHSLDDVKRLLLREGVASDSEIMAQLREAIDKKDLITEDFKSFALTYLVEWLYPHLEPTNKLLIAQGNKDQIITKEQFRDQMKTALRDISAAGYWLGATINSEDPVSAAVGLALKDIVYKDHQENLEVKHSLEKAYHAARGTQLYASAANEEAFNLQFLREADVWEKVGETEDGEPLYDYVKRLAFHTDYLYDVFDKERRALYDRIGPKPSRDNKVLYKMWQKEVAQFYSQNTQVVANVGYIIEQKQKELSKRQFERWILENTKEVDEETYDSGMKKSDFFKNKVYTVNPKRGTFRIYTGELVKPAEKYRNHKHTEMMQHEYYRNLYKAYKQANDKLGNYGLKYGIIPQISKGKHLFSDLSWKQGVKENLKQLKENTKRSLRGEFDESRTIQRQDGTEVKKVPIQFTRMLNSEDLTVDLLEGVLKFSQMANNYESMTEIEPNILLLKTVLNGDFNLGIKGRDIAKTNSKGKGVINAITKKLVPKMAKDDMLNKRLNEFINDIVYGDEEFKDTVDIPLIGEVSLNKLGDRLGFLTSLQNMAVNFTGGINNVIIGNYNNSIEAMGGRFYDKKDWIYAHKEYFAHMHEFLGEIAGQVTCDINLMAEHYDVPQGDFQDQFGNNISGGKVNQMFKTSSLFFIQRGGEHEIQVSGMIALMHATKLKDKQGNETNLYAAWKKANGDFKKVREDNEWGEQDDAAFRNRLHAVTKNLQGIYNKFDKATLQRRWYGKMALMFRKYMFSSFKARYGNLYVDYELGTTQEGYWRTFAKKMGSEIKDYKWQVLTRMWTKDGYNEMEKAAVNKTLYEIGVIMAAWALAGLASAAGDDDDAWLEDEAALQITRFSADITQFLSPKDFIRVIRNPAASLNMIEKWIGWFEQLFSPTEVYERKSGIAEKGDNKLWIKTLKIMPVARQWINFMTPEEQIKFYNLSGSK